MTEEKEWAIVCSHRGCGKTVVGASPAGAFCAIDAAGWTVALVTLPKAQYRFAQVFFCPNCAQLAMAEGWPLERVPAYLMTDAYHDETMGKQVAEKQEEARRLADEGKPDEARAALAEAEKIANDRSEVAKKANPKCRG